MTSQRAVRGSTRKRALPILVAGIATARGYRIHYTSDLGFGINQKDKVILVPSLRTIGSDEDAEVLEGGIDHELGHDHETDPEYSGTVFEHPLMHCVWNAIEDPRMELGFFVKFPGARRNIGRTLEIMTSRGCFGKPEATDHPASILMSYLNQRLRYEELGQTFCAGFLPDTIRAAEQMFGPVAQQAYAIALDVVRNERGRQGTWKTVEATRKIFALFEAAQHPDQGGSGDSEESLTDQDGDGDDSPDTRPSGCGATSTRRDAGSSVDVQPGTGRQDSSASADASAQDPANPSAGTASAAAGEPNDGQSSSQQRTTQPSGQGAGGGAAGPGPVSPLQKRAIDDVLQASAADAGNAGKGLEELIAGTNGVGSTSASNASFDVNAEENRHASQGVIDHATLLQHQEAARRISLDLSVKLEDLLMSYDRVDRRHRRSGRFDSTRCVQARLGDFRVYERALVTESLNTGVVMLIDDSGSMYNDEAPLAQAAFFGIGNVLDKCEVPFAGASFGSQVHLLHAFGDDWRKTMGTADFRDHGGTWMEAAFYFAIEQLSSREEERRIVLIITDGEPSNWEDTEVMIREAQRLNIETRCVLIGPSDEACRRFEGAGTRPGVARTPAEIPQAVFTTLENALVEV